MPKIYNDISNLKFFASGTCADIYLAEEKNVVVKVVKLKNEKEFESKKRAIKSVYAEHEIINLIGEYTSYGVSISKKNGYITMDKVHGESLSNIMEYDKYMEIDPTDAISILKDWTKQVKALHNYGICHYSLHRSNLFLNKNKGYIIDFGNAVLDSDYKNDYKYLVHSNKIKNNTRGIFHIYQDFRFFMKNCKKFVENIYSEKGSKDFVKMKKIYDYIKEELKNTKENPKKKYNYAADFYKFMNSIH